MGIKNSKKKIIPINDECPITLEPIKDFERIILGCKHQFKLYPIQYYCLSSLTIDCNIHCPMCKNKLSKSDFKKIFKKWCLLKLKYDNWDQKNLIFTNDLIYYPKKMNIIKGDNFTILQPLNKINSLYQSTLFCTSQINFLKYSKHSFIYKKLNDNITTQYGEDIKKYNYCLKADINGNHSYQYYILKIFDSINKKYKNKRIEREIHKLNSKMYFFFSDINEIKSFDTFEGDMKEHFVLKKRRCQIMFNTYLINGYNETYLINKIYAIIYY